MKPQDVISRDNIVVSPFPHLTTNFPTSHVNVNIVTFGNFSKMYAHIITLFSFDVT